MAVQPISWIPLTILVWECREILRGLLKGLISQWFSGTIMKVFLFRIPVHWVCLKPFNPQNQSPRVQRPFTFSAPCGHDVPLRRRFLERAEALELGRSRGGAMSTPFLVGTWKGRGRVLPKGWLRPGGARLLFVLGAIESTETRDPRKIGGIV